MKNTMKELLINWEESLSSFCRENNLSFPSNSISVELINALSKYKIVFESWFWNLNPSHLIWIFRDVKSKKVLKRDNLFKTLLANHVMIFNNIEFQNEELNLSRNVSLLNCKWKCLTIKKSTVESKTIKFENNKLIKKVQFTDFIWETEIFIDNNSKINDLHFINFNSTWIINIRLHELEKLNIINSHIESRKVNFININIKKLTDILDSDLWETKFNWIIFNKLKIRNSSLIDVVFNWCNFPEYIEDFWNNEKQKDNYRQLKFVMDKIWNHTQANKFFAKEMEYYEKSLWIENKSIIDIFKKSHLERYKWENTQKLWEKIVLIFSKWINNFWNNWIRSAFLLLMLSFLATIIDFWSWQLWKDLQKFSSEYWNILWDILMLPILLLIQLIAIKFKAFKNFWTSVDFLLDNFFYFLIFITITLFFLNFFMIENLHWSFSVFSNYLNPLGFLPEYYIEDWEKNYIVYNWIENLAFVIYKILYWVILWHLIVAAKRTTKR